SHAFIVALADIADQAIGVAVMVDLVDAQIFRAQQDMQTLAGLHGKMVMVSEFFNEDDPDFDHSLDKKMSINWVESWEVVLADEEHQ
ncbi:MAG: hypothetical protein E7L34_12355, partial [Klebsiella pneumoniae]|nr:hypothetical protein [Klebsiella pneumoniae]